jgi:uncharacterized protein (DUF58 family)
MADGTRERAAPLPREILRRIRRIEIRTNRVVNETLAGSYHSVFKGRGMEFSEVREYVPGDDVRAIDWNVTSRMGTPYVKKFVEERELTVALVLDASGSGEFGSARRLKREVATEIGALLAFSAIKNNDRVALMLFSDEVETWVPPRKGREHVLRVIREMLYFAPRRRGTDIARALAGLNGVLHKRSVVFLISDFLADGYARLLKVTNRRHDLVAIVLSDPREEEMPALGLVEVEDPESGERLLVDTSDRRLRQHYRRVATDTRLRRSRYLRQAKVESVEVRTDQPYDRPLVQFMAERARRIRR